jgi:hypothetical protein
MRRVRITRIPLSPNEREELRMAGRLPEDYTTRQLEVNEYLDLADGADEMDDDQLRRLALRRTQLVFKGERALVEEVDPETGAHRPLNGYVVPA